MRGASAGSRWRTAGAVRLAIVLGCVSCCRAASDADTPQLPFDPLPDDAAEGPEDDDEVMPIDAAPLPPDEHVELFPVLVSRGERPLELHPLVDGLLASADLTLAELRDDGARIDRKLGDGLPSITPAFPRFFALAGRWPDAAFATFDDGSTFASSSTRWTKTTPDDAWIAATSPKAGALVALRVGPGGHPLVVTKPAVALPALPADFDALAISAGAKGDIVTMSRDGLATLSLGGARYVMDVLPPDVGHGVSLSARAHDDVWVLGDHGVGHFDGASWSVTPAPFVMGEEIAGTIGSDGEAWAIEWMMGFSRLFHRRPSGAWSHVPVPDVLAGQKPSGGARWFPEGVVSNGPGDVWVVAAYRHEASSGGAGSPSVVLHTKAPKRVLEMPSATAR